MLAQHEIRKFLEKENEFKKSIQNKTQKGKIVKIYIRKKKKK